MAINLFDTDTPFQALRERIRDRIVEVVDRGIYILGPEVEAFERELADYLGARHVIGVANGTDAITIALGRSGSAPATRWSCRRSRSTPRPRRSSTPGARPCSATSIRTRATSRPTPYVRSSPRARPLS